MQFTHDTIAAISTPIGTAGIGIIRISGNDAENIAKRIFRSKKKGGSLKNFHLHLGNIVDPKSGASIDEVLLSVMRAPFSYTRETVVEINSHSGYVILSNILHIILQNGARLAEPGEFTLRAFLNGRIDLTQAEAIVDLINAKSAKSLKHSINQLNGALNRQIRAATINLTHILAEIEACIDFPSEQSTPLSNTNIIRSIKTHLLEPLKVIVDSYAQRKILHEGINAAIIGRVNVGKSSILNRLLEEERAIVTPVAGTTRDIIEGTINIKGIPIRFIDTAGIRKVSNIIEKKGIGLTKVQIKRADLILFVVDQSRPLNRYDLCLLKEVTGKTSILIINKIDLPGRVSEKKMDCAFSGFSKVRVSALSGEGFSLLGEEIFLKIMHDKKDITNESIIANLRHKVKLDGAIKSLKKAVIDLEDNIPLEFIADDLYQVKDELNEITGEKLDDDILTEIFANFCVGK